MGLGPRSDLPLTGIRGSVLRAADFDGDTHVDLLALGTDPSGIVSSRLWRGTGAGSFRDPIDPGIRGCSNFAVAGAADGDAVADLVLDDCDRTMSLLAGTDSGVFAEPLTVPTGLVTRNAGLVDLDRDGLPEIAVMGEDTSGSVGLSIIERTAAGGVQAPASTRLADISSTFDPTGLGFVDVDEDGRFDALLTQAGQPGGLRLAPGRDGFAFGPPRPVGPPQLVVQAALVRDLDEDTRPDVLAVDFDREALVFLRAENSELVERNLTSVPGLRLGPASGGDIDADDHFDLLLFEPGGTDLQAWFGRGDGSFSGPFDVDFETPIGQVALLDLDEDGALDIVAATFDDGGLQVLLTDP